MFEKGCKDQRNKIGPGRMLEALRNKYPERLDLPSETEIRQYITALTAKYNKHSTIHIKRGIQEPFKTIITNIVVELHYLVKPKDALDQFKGMVVEHLCREDFPDDVKVKSFISELKSNYKKSQTHA